MAGLLLIANTVSNLSYYLSYTVRCTVLHIPLTIPSFQGLLSAYRSSASNLGQG